MKGLVELDPLMLTPRTDAIADHDITDDPTLVELAASLSSSQVVAWPPPVTQLVDEAPAAVTCDCMQTPSQHADSTRLTPPRAPPHPRCRLSRGCNTPGVYHQLSGGFKLKHDRLVELTMPKSNLWK
jgi:hypothetical protein